jgi:peptidoglycan/LPS O-acetylase OafA/YrhL
MPRLLRMDGLRGVLAVYVMIAHALPFTTLPRWLTHPFSHGEAAVDLFFCLSGLVIMNSLEHHGTAGRFLRARAWRLMPVYVPVLLVSVALLLAGDPLPSMPFASVDARSFWAAGLPPHPWAHLLAHLTLSQGLIPQGVLPYAYITLLGPAWSLSAEAQFYGLVALLGARAGGVAIWLLLALAVSWSLAPPGGYLAMDRAFLPAASIYFALGLASARYVRTGERRMLGLCLATACVLAGPTDKIIIPLAWALVLWLQRHAAGAFLQSRILLFLGAVSYPLYLVNEPVQRALAMLIAPRVAHFTPVWLPLALILPVLVAWALHMTIETPFARVPRRRPLPTAPIRPI